MIKNKIIITIILALVISITIPTAFAITTTDTLYGCSPPDSGAFIDLVNKTTGLPISQVAFTVSGLTVIGCTGLSIDPTTNIMYAIAVHSANTTDRHLVTVNPVTGVGVDIGGIGDKMASLAFLADGSLRSITGFGSPTPEQYFSINKSTGARTLLCDLTANVSVGGQTLGFNYDDGKMYHHTGIYLGEPRTERFATIDDDTITPCGITNLGNSTGQGATGGSEILSLAYNTNQKLFFMYDQQFFFNTMNSTGFITNIDGSNPRHLKGMAFLLSVAVDTTNPVISTTVSEPIPINQDSVFDEFEFMSCIDDTDGDITNTMSTVGTVDTSTPRSYFVDYTCTDVASNQSTLQVQYIVKRSPTGSGGITTTAPTVGGVSTAPTASTTPPLSFVPREPTEPPRRTLDEIFDLFSFLFREVEPIPTLEVVPESVTEIPPPLSQPPIPTEIRPSFIESIQNFFARLFG